MPTPIPFPKHIKERRVQPGVRSLGKKRHALRGLGAVSLGDLDFSRGKSSGTLEKVQRVESAFV